MHQYRIIEAERLIILRISDTFALEGLRRLFEAILADCPGVVRFDVLWDVRLVDSFPSREELEDVARLSTAMGFDEHPRCSVTLVGQPAHYGLARMYQLMTESQTNVSRRVAMSLQEAADLLQRPEASLRAALESGDWRTTV